MRKTFDNIDRRLTTLSKLKRPIGGKAVNPVNSNITYLLLYSYVLTTLAPVTAFFVKSGYLLTFDRIDSLGVLGDTCQQKDAYLDCGYLPYSSPTTGQRVHSSLEGN